MMAVDNRPSPTVVWTQLSAIERGYCLMTHIGNVPLHAMLDARQRQSLGASPMPETVAQSLRQMVPILETAISESRDILRAHESGSKKLTPALVGLNETQIVLNTRRVAEMRAVLAEIDALTALPMAAE